MWYIILYIIFIFYIYTIYTKYCIFWIYICIQNKLICIFQRANPWFPLDWQRFKRSFAGKSPHPTHKTVSPLSWWENSSSMKFSSHIWLHSGRGRGMAGCGLFFTLGTFRLWQLTDLWRININYAAQQARCRGGLRRGGRAGYTAAVAAFYLLAAVAQLMTLLLKAH